MEDISWKTSGVFHEDGNMLSLTSLISRYLTWWHSSDIDPSMVGTSKTIARVVCRPEVGLPVMDGCRFRNSCARLRMC